MSESSPTSSPTATLLLCLKSPKMRKLAVLLMGVGLGAVVYLLFLQVGPYHMATLSLVPFPQSVRAAEIQTQYPKWWQDCWSRSAVAGQLQKFVGEKPMFPPCRETPTKKETFHFEERPLKYLKTSKNPCWYEDKKSGFKALRCVPYFYMAGVAKGAATDLSRRLRLHPDVFHGTEKEYHWWDRFRYGLKSLEDPENSEGKKSKTTYDEYTQQIVGKEIASLQIEIRHAGSSVRVFGDFTPSYFWDPQNWYVLEGNQGCMEPRVIVAQHIKHIYPGARIILTFRHPTSRLYSRFLSRMPRVPELKGSKPEDFHKFVVQSVQNYKKCFRTWSVRHCVYNLTLYRETPVRLMEGMYAVFMADWLKVFSRKQMFFIRYEDYGAHERRTINEAVAFLGLTPLNSSTMEKVMGPKSTMVSKENPKVGDMTDKTKKLLNDFYQPFIDQLADMLGDERFRWKDISH